MQTTQYMNMELFTIHTIESSQFSRHLCIFLRTLLSFSLFFFHSWCVFLHLRQRLERDNHNDRFPFWWAVILFKELQHLSSNGLVHILFSKTIFHTFFSVCKIYYRPTVLLAICYKSFDFKQAMKLKPSANCYIDILCFHGLSMAVTICLG